MAPTLKLGNTIAWPQWGCSDGGEPSDKERPVSTTRPLPQPAIDRQNGEPSTAPAVAQEHGSPHLAPDHRAIMPPGRLGSPLVNRILSLIGTPWSRRLARAALYLNDIRRREDEFNSLSDAEIRSTGLRLKGRARGGEKLTDLLPEAFGLVCVAAKRTLGLRPFDVQLGAGAVMFGGALAEVATGEGKTLIAALPAYLHALAGKGVHVATVNDYLAKRDKEWLEPLYNSLGLSIGVLQQQMSESERKLAYEADVTYGTASEFGFDFLRDRLKLSGAKGNDKPFWAAWQRGGSGGGGNEDPRVQARGHHFALVDEADNIFIDEARTPLIISGETRPASPEECVVYMWADGLARQMQYQREFNFNVTKQKLELTDAGRQMARYSNPPSGEHADAMDKLHEAIEQALQAHYRFRRDQHYMIEKGKVVIIDEGTGRRMPDRHWSEGLHQAVEAKERVEINKQADHAAKITFQSFFRLYTHLAGMSGTAVQNRWEIYRVYKLWVVQVPTNRPVIRRQLPDMIFPNEDSKFDAVVGQVKDLKAAGRSVLIGTRTVDKSEKLSEKLSLAGIEHRVLNARQHENEANIVADAGQVGRVTIATNMAGRGTDIKPAPGVVAAGGLHVIGTERHEAIRIDRQLAGRAGRQGDPGSAQFLMSLDDELLEGLGPWRKKRLEEMGRRAGTQAGGGGWQRYLGLFQRAQVSVEARHLKNRIDLLVHERQRQEILKDIGADPYVD